MPANRKPSQVPILALTSGDPAGIGLDITLKSWKLRTARNLPHFVLYADVKATQERARALNLDVPIARISSPVLARTMFQNSLPMIDMPLTTKPEAGCPDATNGASVIKAIDQALTDTMDGLTAALVTNPISKTTLYESGFKFPGHTEYLAHLAQRYSPEREASHPVMMLACQQLRVVPLTIHIPLRDVPKIITEDLIIQTAQITYRALIIDFAISNPRLAITGLNPHAGEDGALGKEDAAIIAPAIQKLQQQGMSVTGPHPADTLFHAQARETYDAVIAMYHDQALIPIKTLAFDKGVNITLGLPFVRTSPDHGTAFDIAGSGKASPESLIASLQMAAQVAHRRTLSHTAQTP